MSREERNRLESEIRAANLALSHYRTAIEPERSVLKQGDSGVAC